MPIFLTQFSTSRFLRKIQNMLTRKKNILKRQRVSELESNIAEIMKLSDHDFKITIAYMLRAPIKSEQCARKNG